MLSTIKRAAFRATFLLSLGCAFTANASLAAGRPDVYILTLWKLKAGASYEQAKTAAEGLNPSYKKLKGFEKRHLYYDKDKATWIDQTKWKHSDAANEGSKSIEKDAAMKKLEELVDKTSVQTFHSERLFEIGS